MYNLVNWSSTNLENIKSGELRTKSSASGDRVLRYYIDFRHTVLNLHKEVSAPEIDILQNKVDTLMASWDQKYLLSQGKELAEDMCVKAELQRERLRNTLKYTLNIDDRVDWDVLKDLSDFTKEEFAERPPFGPVPRSSPRRPQIDFFQSLFGQRKRIESKYRVKCEEYENALRDDVKELERKRHAWQKRLAKWDEEQAGEKRKFVERQQNTNAKVDAVRKAWVAGSPSAIIEHTSIVLDASDHDELISKDYLLQYNEDSKTLLVDYVLPAPDDLPTVRSVKFVGSSGELKETQILAKDKKVLYDDICYQVCLRTIHELFEADTPGNIENILFNGSTNYIDNATGHEVSATILSLMVCRDEFLKINLSGIDPKACFKNLKGVSASSLIGLSPIAPVMKLDKEDRRFVDARPVELGDDGSTNLAAMDWEAFEHLVREIFEKEFAERGGEVKVTQGSGDGGVDAIAFDPDPISGGKIVIQAKRYTKTVGVEAVRDLYGTTINEGAIKGILVTTTDYGPDAYKFAADKPLTLMTGAHLLHLLAKHGIKAKINVREARKELGLIETSFASKTS